MKHYICGCNLRKCKTFKGYEILAILIILLLLLISDEVILDVYTHVVVTGGQDQSEQSLCHQGVGEEAGMWCPGVTGIEPSASFLMCISMKSYA